MMDQMAPFLVIGTVVVLLLARFFRGARRPPNPRFICGKCRKLSPHNHRTIGAWRAGKEKFFCGACHRAWLATQPHRLPERDMPREQATGCFGVMLWLVAIPTMAAIGLAIR